MILLLNFQLALLPFPAIASDYGTPLTDPVDKVEMGMLEKGKGKDGYALFFPKDSDSATVVVFMHGYGGYNPMFYGGWIKHLVSQGHTVIFPYYQDNMIQPKPQDMAFWAAKAIRDALQVLHSNKDYPKPKGEVIHYIGHSFGGAISAELSAMHREYDLPSPGILFMAMAGTGPTTKGQLPTYESIPDHVLLIAVVGTDDEVVGTEFSELVYLTASNVKQKLWITLDRRAGTPALIGNHNVPCSRDSDLDNGTRNYNYGRTIFTGKLDAYDRLAMWRTFDWAFERMQSGRIQRMTSEELVMISDLGLDEEGNPYAPLELQGTMLPHASSTSSTGTLVR